MHSEHLSNLHPGWVVGGWLVAVAVTSGAFVVFVGLGLLTPDGPWSTAWTLAATVLGFLVGGLFVGLRWSDAPIIHGAAITFLSATVWLVGMLFLPDTLGGGGPGRNGAVVLAMVLAQLVASVAGGLLGRRMTLRGETPTIQA